MTTIKLYHGTSQYLLTFLYLFWGLINMLISQTFVNKGIDNKLYKDDKNKKGSSKGQAFTWEINIKEMIVGLLVDQDVV